MNAVVIEGDEPLHPDTSFDACELIATSPSGASGLRATILNLAVKGRLVPQNSNDEPADKLMERLFSRGPVRRTPTAAPEVYTAQTEAPYELPCGWLWAKLGDLIEGMGSGWSPACDDGPRVDTDRWAVLRTTAVQAMQFVPTEHKALPMRLAPRSDIEVKPGDVLVTRAGPVNRVGISCAIDETPHRLMLSDKIVRFRLRGEELLPAYVVLTLNAGWSKECIEAAKTGMAASQVNISQSDLKAIPIPVCSYTEQRRIVSRVEELMKLCDALEAKEQLADEQHARLTSTLFEALATSESPQALAENWQRVAEHFDILLDRPEAIGCLEQVVHQLAVRGMLVPQVASEGTGAELLERVGGAAESAAPRGRTQVEQMVEDDAPFPVPTNWAWSRFGLLVDVSGGVTLGRKGAIAEPLTLPYLRVANVQRGYLNLSDEIKSVTIDAKELSRFQLKAGDLLITEGGDWDKVGRTCIWRDEIPTCLHQNHVFRARGLTQEWLPAWGELYLNSSDARAYFAASAKQTTNLASINMTELRGCPFPLPPLAEQRRIVARVEELRRLCAQMREKLTQAREVQARLADALVARANA